MRAALISTELVHARASTLVQISFPCSLGERCLVQTPKHIVVHGQQRRHRSTFDGSPLRSIPLYAHLCMLGQLPCSYALFLLLWCRHTCNVLRLRWCVWVYSSICLHPPVATLIVSGAEYVLVHKVWLQCLGGAVGGTAKEMLAAVVMATMGRLLLLLLCRCRCAMERQFYLSV